jgi:hypothetical protein
MRRSTHVIVRAYVESGAFDIACPTCGMAAAEYCLNPDGRTRRVPCVRRAIPLVVETSPSNQLVRTEHNPHDQ